MVMAPSTSPVPRSGCKKTSAAGRQADREEADRLSRGSEPRRVRSITNAASDTMRRTLASSEGWKRK